MEKLWKFEFTTNDYPNTKIELLIGSLLTIFKIYTCLYTKKDFKEGVYRINKLRLSGNSNRYFNIYWIIFKC